jgi:hypothetical protein
VGKVTKVQGSSPLNKLPFHPDLYFYGVHGVEALYAVMGPGCVSVSREVQEEADITTGKWRDGRIGVYYGVLAGARPPAIRVWGVAGVAEATSLGGYEGMLEAMAKFFHTGQPPVDPAETIELFEFMSAAQVSHEQGGAEVRLEDMRK